MRKIVQIIVLALLVTSCGKNDKGQVVGVKGKSWNPERPYGMVLVEGGSFIMGKSDYDIAGLKDAPTKTVTVPSFYMDETEITNSEYKQFVYHVRDSVVRQKLAEAAEFAGEGEGGNQGSIQDFAFRNSQSGQEEE
ncbi:MAG: formylglycine-generating enzyme family protein, partial [Flavobacteriaceae bacterium]